MSFSRNVNHDKMSACHQGHEGNEESTDCNVRQRQAGSVNNHERSIIGGGPILLMGDSRYDRLCGRWKNVDFSMYYF